MNPESLRTLLFSFIQTLIFGDLCIPLRLPLVKSPHTHWRCVPQTPVRLEPPKYPEPPELAFTFQLSLLPKCQHRGTAYEWFGSEQIPMYCCYVLLSAADWPVWQQEIWRGWGRSPVWWWSGSCVSSAAPGGVAGFSELRAVLLNLSLIQFILVLVLLLLSGKSFYFSFTFTYRNHFTFSFTLSETKWNILLYFYYYLIKISLPHSCAKYFVGYYWDSN